MSQTKIEWTECTWNPVTGCTKISSGCKNCYAERMARRLKAMGQPNYKRGFEVCCHPHLINAPLGWKKSRLVFVNSMSDLFHSDVPDEFIFNIFETMNKTPQHTYQVLTKRADRLKSLAPFINWTNNIWMGVTVESREYLNRRQVLTKTPAKVKFLSLEPLLSPMPLGRLKGIDWVIVGGESGPGARPIHEEWVKDIRDVCTSSHTPFFFKQWGGVNKKKTGRLLEGRTWDEFPDGGPVSSPGARAHGIAFLLPTGERERKSMRYTFFSRKLKQKITFSIPGTSYIFVDLNHQPGTLGNQICRGGALLGDTLSYSGDDNAVFGRVCRRWWRAYLALE